MGPHRPAPTAPLQFVINAAAGSSDADAKRQVISGNAINRWEGALFLFYYIGYTAFLLLAAQQHDALTTYGAVMTTIVLPLTAITLAVIALRQWRIRQR